MTARTSHPNSHPEVSGTKRRANKSGYRGVYKNNKSGWQAQICFGPRSNKRKIMLGTFETQGEAAHAYDDAAREYHGDRAVLNFPAFRTENRIRSRMERKAASTTENPLVSDDRLSQLVMVPTENPPEMPAPKPQPVPERLQEAARAIPPGGCPACGADSALYAPIGSCDGDRRCRQCGHQPRRGEVDSNGRRILKQDGIEEVFSPAGVSRGQFADVDWRRANLQKGNICI